MSSLRKEIEAEMTRTRLDKGRLFDLLLKIVDNGGSGGPGGVGPAGPAGPAGECKCKCISKEATPAAKAPAKKAPAKKKVVSATVV